VYASFSGRRAPGERENKLRLRQVDFKVPDGVATGVAPLVRAPASARRGRKALGTG
jgi:hypothetical protein